MPEEQPLQQRSREQLETQEKDIQFLFNLENAMQEARRLLNALVRDFIRIDDLTLNETLMRVHVSVVDDLYYRIRELAERRGRVGEFEYDMAVLTEVVNKFSVDDPDYHSKLISLYFRILARYQYWMDELGILLTVIPFPANFAENLIEAMQEEKSRTIGREEMLKRFKQKPETEDDEDGR